MNGEYMLHLKRHFRRSPEIALWLALIPVYAVILGLAPSPATESVLFLSTPIVILVIVGKRVGGLPVWAIQDVYRIRHAWMQVGLAVLSIVLGILVLGLIVTLPVTVSTRPSIEAACLCWNFRRLLVWLGLSITLPMMGLIAYGPCIAILAGWATILRAWQTRRHASH